LIVSGHQEPELQPGGVRIEEPLHSLPGRQLPLLVHLRDSGGAPSFLEACSKDPVFLGEGAQAAAGGAHDSR
jgi:hypothetical protein